MSPIPLNSDAPNGWNPWAAVQPRNTTADIFLSDTPLAAVYAPSNAFWVRSLIDHCLLPWTSTNLDAYTKFIAGGGAGGTIIGAVAGLADAQINLSLPATATFALGSNKPAPRLGFCLGTQYKHQSYLQIDVIRNELPGTANDIVLGRLDLAQNSRFQRIYLHHGEVVRFAKEGEDFILDIGLDEVPDTLVGSTINIVSQSGENLQTTVEGSKGNGDLIVSNSFSSAFPDSGDYYELDNVWSLEDPFLMSGFWLGSEESWPTSAFNHSGHNLFFTSHNRPYLEGEITGVYTYHFIPDVDETDETLVEGIVPFAVGTPITDTADYEWRFSGVGGTSEIYPNETRYIGNTSSGQFEVMPEGSLDDYSTMLEDPEGFQHIRVEISTGGKDHRHNWHAPALRSEYIHHNGKVYKILEHVEANIVDIDINSVDNQTLFDPRTDIGYHIFHQYGWMINEHYNGQIGSPEGAYSGTISTVDYTENTNKSVVLVDGMTVPTVMNYEYEFYTPDDIKNTFHERFTKEHVHTFSEPIKAYTKRQNWKLIVGNTGYDILGVTGSEVTVTGNLSDFVGSTAWVAFDDPYETYGSLSSEGAIFYDHSGREGTNQICLESEYTLGPYRIDLALNTRFGFCDGIYFGFGPEVGNNSKVSTNFITTPSVAGGIASLYHELLDEDWVVYKDTFTGKLTIRRGSLGFKDYPDKTEVVIGSSQSFIPLGGGSTFTLDSSKDRVRRIQFSNPVAVGDTAFMFTYGSNKNTYGFPISGEGVVDLRGLQLSGIGAGNVSSDAYTADGVSVSPVYVYKQRDRVEYRNVLIQDMAIDTKDGPIGLTDLNPEGSSVSVENLSVSYVNDNQTLGEDVGFYDILRMNDGENMLVYGTRVDEFNIGDTSYNSASNSSYWSNPNGVMALSSPNDSFRWGTPFKKGFSDNSNFQFPLMLLNSTTYLTSVYNKLNNTIVIFTKCIQGGSHYIGCFQIAFENMLSRIYKCDHPDGGSSSPISFLYRDPTLEEESSVWTEGSNILDVNSEDAMFYNTDIINDKFVRVVGEEGTNSDITFNEVINIASAHILSDGTYVLLYDTQLGIKAAFSNTSGRFWDGSDVILAKQGGGGTIIDGKLYYVTPASGIAVKYTYENNLYALAKNASKNKGIDGQETEAILQQRFDQMDVDLLGTGQINLQKISGYKDDEGITRVFYYNLDNNLTSAFSTRSSGNNNSTKWEIGNNF